MIAWSGSTIGWTLQQNTDLASGTWTTLTNTVNTVNGQNQIMFPKPLGNHFYRLQHP